MRDEVRRIVLRSGVLVVVVVAVVVYGLVYPTPYAAQVVRDVAVVVVDDDHSNLSRQLVRMLWMPMPPHACAAS